MKKFIDDTDIARLDAVFDACTKVSIVGHEHPDGDALGSTLALRSFLSDVRGKDAAVLFPDRWPWTIDFIARGDEDALVDASSEPEAAAERIACSDLIVELDHPVRSRTGALAPLVCASSARKVLIDHHPFPEREAFDLVFSSTEVSSASELLYWIVRALPDGDRLPLKGAERLFAGMTTDTNNFANSTFPSTFEMASGLIERGVDREKLLSGLYNSFRENRFRAMGAYLSEWMRITPDGVAYAVADSSAYGRFDLADGETEGFVNLPLGIETVRMSVFLREDPEGYFRVSVRTKDDCPANDFARRYFSGGGHRRAAGGRLYKSSGLATKADAEEYVCESAARFMRELADGKNE